MINILDDNLTMKSILHAEEAFLNDYLESQQNINNSLHINIRQLVNSQVINNIEQSEKFCNDLFNINKMLNRSNANISSIEQLINSFNLITLEDTNYKSKIENYNNLYVKLFDKIVKNTNALENYLKNCPTSKKDVGNVVEEVSSENTLLISEIDDKVVLPYTLKELNEILSNNPDKYKTISDVINNIYTKPLKYYHNSSLSRFKEAFKLVKEREKGTFMQALDLAFELFSNYNLHPAVISACKNLNELDVYLSCLEYNELNDFHFFKTIFKMHPLAVKPESN